MIAFRVGSFLMAVISAFSLAGCNANSQEKSGGKPVAVKSVEMPLLACPGRIETRDDPMDLGAAANGVLATLHVRQNDKVRAGQVVARVDCSDIAADMKQYEAERVVAVQSRARLVAGGRPEERAAAASRLVASEAALRERRAWYDRVKYLVSKDAIAKSELDKAEREWHVAEADVKTGVEMRRAAAAEPLAEDLAKADAEISAAEARMAAARTRLSRCTVVSPINGTVLHTYATAGEFLSATMPKTILTVADLTRLRVRAEVDEQDFGKVKSATRVTVISDAWPGKTFEAALDFAAPTMGRRHTRTGEPAEKSDRDVLETLVNLKAQGGELPLALRVTVQFWK